MNAEPWTSIEAWFAQNGTWFWILAIIVGSFLALSVVRFVVRRVVNQIVHGVKKRVDAADTEALHASPLYQVRIVQRTKTIGSVLNTVAAWVIGVLAVLLILSVLNVQPTALVATAGFFGAAAGIGAQGLIKDFLNGLFMVFEDQLGIGDVVDLGPATGVVESVGIRITELRDVNGTLWYVRNGEITRVGNMSQGWARAIIDLAVPYESDVDAVEKTMLDVAIALSEEPKWHSRIIDKPELWGIESISDSAIVIRLVVKTRSNAKDDVARELRGRLLRGLDAIGVELPALNSIVLEGMDGAASVRGARPPRTAELPKQPGT